jgi:hypothetical protein
MAQCNAMRMHRLQDGWDGKRRSPGLSEAALFIVVQHGVVQQIVASYCNR